MSKQKRSRRRRKRPSILPLSIALSAIVLGALSLVLLGSGLFRGPTPSGGIAEETETSDVAAQMPSASILRIIGQQHIRMEANDPAGVVFEEEDRIWTETETGRVIIAGYLDDSAEKGRLTPRERRFYAVGIVLDPEIMEESQRAYGRRLLQLGKCHRLMLGRETLVEKPWPTENDPWAEIVQQFRNELPL